MSHIHLKKRDTHNHHQQNVNLIHDREHLAEIFGHLRITPLTNPNPIVVVSREVILSKSSSWWNLSNHPRSPSFGSIFSSKTLSDIPLRSPIPSSLFISPNFSGLMPSSQKHAGRHLKSQRRHFHLNHLRTEEDQGIPWGPLDHLGSAPPLQRLHHFSWNVRTLWLKASVCPALSAASSVFQRWNIHHRGCGPNLLAKSWK